MSIRTLLTVVLALVFGISAAMGVNMLVSTLNEKPHNE